jgi:hypothetical protein
MPTKRADDPALSRIDCTDPATEIDYYERRLDETLIQAARAAGICSNVAHAGRASLYRIELSQLRSGPDLTPVANPLLDQAREAGVIDLAPQQRSKPILSRGRRRSAKGMMAKAGGS